MAEPVFPLPTRDPISGSELIVTRLESPKSGVVIEGSFSLGWIGRLTPDQVDFVGVLLRNRNNLQKLAGELDVAYNTARSRLDDVVEALGGPVEPPGESPVESPVESRNAKERNRILDQLSAGEIEFDEAMKRLSGED